MVAQIKVVAILMIVHGVMLSLCGGYFIFNGIVAMGMPAPGGPGAPPPGFGPMMDLMGGVMLVIGLLALSSGVLHIAGGARGLVFRNRWLSLAALFSNVAVILTCYCIPTGLAMMVYGLIVLFQSDVAQAYEMVGRGISPAEAIRKLSRKREYGDDRDDFDDQPGRYGEERNIRRYDTDDDDRPRRRDYDEPA